MSHQKGETIEDMDASNAFHPDDNPKDYPNSELVTSDKVKIKYIDTRAWASSAMNHIQNESKMPLLLVSTSHLAPRFLSHLLITPDPWFHGQLSRLA